MSSFFHISTLIKSWSLYFKNKQRKEVEGVIRHWDGAGHRRQEHQVVKVEVDLTKIDQSWLEIKKTRIWSDML